MQIQRREFLRLLGGVSGAIALGGFGIDEVIDIPDELIEQVKRGKGIETWKNTICRQCPGGCGLSVRLMDDVPIMLKGNPSNPVSLGGMCPLGRSSLNSLYSVDRIQKPRRHIGHAGDGRWEDIPWDDALGTIQEALTVLRREGRTNELVCLGSDESRFEAEHIQRFMDAFGSPNYYRLDDEVYAGAAYQLAEGTRRIPAYDMGSADVILSIGANYLEEGYAPVYHTKCFSRSRDRADGTRPELIHADARMNLTASNADRWIPLRPGTYGAFALGIAHVLVRNNLYDSAFVERRTVGFHDWKDARGNPHRGLKSIVQDSYHPARVSELTGIPSETIEEVALAVGEADRAVVLGDQNLRRTEDGTAASLAVQSLNALLGNLGKRGGVIRPDDPPFTSFSAVKQDATARTGNAEKKIGLALDGSYPAAAFSPDSFLENGLSSRPYPTSVLFLFGGNPLFSSIRHHDFETLLRKTPLVVSFDAFANETNLNADIVLPATTFLESWGVSDSVPTVSFPYAGIQQPVIKPFYESRAPADVLIELAGRLGTSVGGAFPYKSLRESIELRSRGLYDSGEGMLADERAGEFWPDRLQSPPPRMSRERSFESFWDKLINKGGWWNPASALTPRSPSFATASKRYELLPASLEETFDQMSKPEIAGFDLQLATFQTLTHRDGRGASDRMLQEMMGQSVRRYWRTWVEMHPLTAEDNGVRDGEWVWIESRRASIRVQATINPGVVPGTVAIPFGLGHTFFGRNATGFGENPNTIMIPQYDDLAGTPATQSTRVRISRRA
jgi:anaerobic selenocysteine-containing dehydrogenase